MHMYVCWIADFNKPQVFVYKLIKSYLFSIHIIHFIHYCVDYS